MELLEALLHMAGEHQQEADYFSTLADGCPDHGPFAWLGKDWQKTADEQRGLADVYYRMADRLAVAVWLDGVMATR